MTSIETAKILLEEAGCQLAGTRQQKSCIELVSDRGTAMSVNQNGSLAVFGEGAAAVWLSFAEKVAPRPRPPRPRRAHPTAFCSWDT